MLVLAMMSDNEVLALALVLEMVMSWCRWDGDGRVGAEGWAGA